MSKSKSSFVCQNCGAHFGKWSGQCTDCGEWNTLVEAPNVSMPHHKKSTKSVAAPSPSGGGSNNDRMNYSGSQSGVVTLGSVNVTFDTRLPTGISEFDRVLGGGLVAGSVVLIGGDPGIGKSTILLQTAANMADPESLSGSALYVTGEESLSQVAMRAQRLCLSSIHLKVMTVTNV